MQIAHFFQIKRLKQSFLLLVVAFLFGCTTSEPTHIPAAAIVVPTAGVPVFIPQDMYHQVARLETLWRISKTYNVDVETIMRANGIKDPNSISVGQRLLIPKVSQVRPVIPIYNVRPWYYIVIHHSATETGNALTIDGMHYRRGFDNGLGYHFLIDNGTQGKQRGQIEVGPRWVKQMNGAHCNAAGMNENGIGICMIGNFSERYVSEQQLNSLVFLVNILRTYYRVPMERVIRHSDVPGKNTECPGKYFPWAEFKRRLELAAG